MAGANQYVKVAGGASADVEPIGEWMAEADILSDGFPNGIVDQLQYNRAWRQATTAMALLGQHLTYVVNEDILDDPTSSIEALWLQLWNAMLKQFAFPDTGSVNVVLTANPPSSGLTFPAPTEGTLVRVLIANTNTAASTYNHFGTGPIQIINSDGTALRRGALFQAGYADLIYTANYGGAWQLLSVSPATIRGLSFGTIVDTINVGSGTYTVPANTFLIQPILYGGGGGSSDSDNSSSGAIGGAGSGGCCIGIPIVTAPGATFSYVVGAGGTRAAFGGTGGNGVTTTFNGGALSAGPGTGSSNATVGFGGACSGGLFNLLGSPGMPYGTGGTGSSGGTGGTSPGPYGSGGGATGTGIAANGGFPGGGAGGPGSGGAETGKSGGNGVIYVLR